MIISKALKCGVALALVATGGLLAGCKSDPPQTGAVNAGGVMAAPTGGSTALNGGLTSETLRPGDQLIVNFTDLPVANPAFEQKIKDDGTITLLLNQLFTAAGKTTGELEKEIRERYVPRYYKYLTVTVKARDATQFYYVGGEVKQAGRQVYISRITLTKAIQSAGDFTDFAKRTKVKLTRVDGNTLTVNCNKVLDGKAPDPEIFPGDKITVPRRVF